MSTTSLKKFVVKTNKTKNYLLQRTKDFSCKVHTVEDIAYKTKKKNELLQSFCKAIANFMASQTIHFNSHLPSLLCQIMYDL